MLYVRYVNLDSESPRWIQSVNIVTIGWVVFFLVGLLAFDSDTCGYHRALKSRKIDTSCGIFILWGKKEIL